MAFHVPLNAYAIAFSSVDATMAHSTTTTQTSVSIKKVLIAFNVFVLVPLSVRRQSTMQIQLPSTVLSCYRLPFSFHQPLAIILFLGKTSSLQVI